mgnify:CR=1 FL=1
MYDLKCRVLHKVPLPDTNWRSGSENKKPNKRNLPSKLRRYSKWQYESGSCTFATGYSTKHFSLQTEYHKEDRGNCKTRFGGQN